MTCHDIKFKNKIKNPPRPSFFADYNRGSTDFLRLGRITGHVRMSVCLCVVEKNKIHVNVSYDRNNQCANF